MHRTTGSGHVSNLHTDGPPGSTITASWCNAIQEELCYLLETMGTTLNTAAEDDADGRTQLYDALNDANLIGITATAAQINTTCANGKYGSQAMVLGDTTAGRVLRMMFVTMIDGTTGVSVKAKTLQEWNGDVIDYEDNLAKGGSTTSFELSAAGDIFTIKGTVLSGTPLGAMVFLRSTPTTDLVTVVGSMSSDDIVITPQNGAGVTQDWTDIVDSGTVGIGVLYITDA